VELLATIIKDDALRGSMWEVGHKVETSTTDADIVGDELDTSCAGGEEEAANCRNESEKSLFHSLKEGSGVELVTG